jgi:hypothetical protein
MAADHHFTIAGRVWLWRYSRLRGMAAGWTIWPDAKRPHQRPKILIDERLKGRARLETEIHEGIHGSFPQLSEEAVTEGARDLARILHAIGYRLVEPS